MIVTCVHVYVKAENIDAFIEACKNNHAKSVLEPGNLRFDFLQLEEDQTQFMLYEAYASEEAAAAHKETDHYLTWRETVAPFMAKDRKGVRYKVLAPLDKEGWGKV